MTYPKLRGAIREVYGTQAAFAEAIGINPSTLHSKLSGRTEFTAKEVHQSMELLGIPVERVGDYFFVN